MSGFIKSFAPLLKKLKKYLLEIILLLVALLITTASLVIYAKNNQSVKEENKISPPSLRQDYGGQAKIFVDVSGAVKKPSVYEVASGARLKDLIEKAGGLSDDADIVVFNRNFNLARIVTDQEKIYIPSTVEINSGIFIQNQRTLDYSSPAVVTQSGTKEGIVESPLLINLNSATIEELDQLPGIGQATANKVIANRPYLKIDELLTKKVVNKNIYEKIKSLISIN